jgi:hypothetical protein
MLGSNIWGNIRGSNIWEAAFGEATFGKQHSGKQHSGSSIRGSNIWETAFGNMRLKLAISTHCPWQHEQKVISTASMTAWTDRRICVHDNTWTVGVSTSVSMTTSTKMNIRYVSHDNMSWNWQYLPMCMTTWVKLALSTVSTMTT